MTQSFDEWFEENYPTQYALKDSTLTCKSFYDGMKIGAESQQAKIDELKMSNHHLSIQVSDSGAYYDSLKRDFNELQSRIDKVLVEVNLYYDTDGMHDVVFQDIADILNGEQK